MAQKINLISQHFSESHTASQGSLMDTCQQGEGRNNGCQVGSNEPFYSKCPGAQAASVLPTDFFLAVAQLHLICSSISQTLGILTPSVYCCQIRVPPHTVFSLIFFFKPFNALWNYFKGRFLKWKCIIYHKWKGALKINKENTEQCYWILASLICLQGSEPEASPFFLFKEMIKTD